MIFAVLDLGISMRRLAALVAALLAICFASPSAMAAKRVALVIGNSNYQNAPALTNPANDAAAITEMFKRADFDVIDSRRDLKAQEMRRALRDFGDKARGADIAVVYFAGHGLEVDGSNYVVPVDAVLERDADAEDEAVSLNRILLAVEPATHLRLVILDACRDNPFAKKMKRTLASRSVGRGLVGVEANKPNTFIAFAAKEGSTALDGDGKNSPFSAALIKHLTTPGLDIRKAFGYVRDDVMSATGNQQEPYTTNSLGGNDVTLVPAPSAPLPAGGNANTEIRRDYELAERVGTREAWDSFVAAHPTGFYTDLAKAQRNKLAAEAAQVAATEKAHAAADEQARLAAEGARASEQAKAAAASKAAEAERLAAEKAKLEAEQAKKLEEAKIAETPPAKADRPAEPAAPVVAELTPPAAPEAARSTAPAQDLPRLLQSELRRVGCKTGDIDSEWNASARKALSSFNDHAGTKFDVKLASLDALDAVKARAGRVCPLDCDRGFRADGDRCVKITCDSDQVLGPNGTCRPRPERAPKVVAHRERRSPAGHGGRCFVYNGASVCE
jgi:Caspase domain